MANPIDSRSGGGNAVIAVAIVAAAFIVSWGGSGEQPRYQLAASDAAVYRMDTDSGELIACVPTGCTRVEAPDRATFRCLDIAYAAGRTGGTAPAVLSAANEVAVAAFLGGRLAWAAIADVVGEVLDQGTGNADEVADVLEADRVARERAQAAVDKRSNA